MKNDIRFLPLPAVALRGMLGTAMFVMAMQSQAQTPPTAAPEPAATASSAASGTSTTSTTLKYSAQDLDRAFAFMDGNKDGKVSRDESQNFRGVYRHFDEADTNKDGYMSREEFENAMNKAAAK